MQIRIKMLAFWFLLLAIMIASCTPQQLQIEGPTPIPTLIPATMPPSNLQPTESAPQIVEGYPAGMPSSEAGRVLYDQHCAECHGLDGNGLVPNARNFADVDYIRGETPASFYIAISEGRGPDMPGFGTVLTSDERWDVTYYVWNFSTSEQSLAEGQNIYTDNCVACHGEDGRSMILGAANFSDSRFMTNQSPSDLYIVVTQGKGSMPAWQARLGQDERWNSIDYIYSLSYVPKEDQEVASATSVPEPTQESKHVCFGTSLQVSVSHWVRHQSIRIYCQCSVCHDTMGHMREENTKLNTENPVVLAKFPHDGVAKSSPLAGTY